MRIISTITKGKKFYVISCILAIILGSAMHFAYDISNKSFLVGLFTPINESVWEHLKLVLFPNILFGIVYSILDKRNMILESNFWYNIFTSTIISMIIIVIGHYTYVAVLDKTSTIFDISLYIVSMIISFVLEYIKNVKLPLNSSLSYKNSKGIILLTLLSLVFIVFTIYPPKINLFKDPITNSYGIYMLIEK